MTEFTGERVVPGQVNDNLWAEHISRYAFAARFAPNRKVLDIGCGTGYGTAELAHVSARTHGIDISPAAVTYARNNYPLPNTTFLAASATSLPFPAASFDMVVAFEVIEHLTDWHTLLREAARVLRPEGLFFVSTPNKLYYTESRGVDGPNPYHTHEFVYEEFQAALAEYFPHSVTLLQNRVEAFAFYPHGTYYSIAAEIAGSRGTPGDAHFFLGVCSHRPVQSLQSFLYVPRAANLLKEREQHIQALSHELQVARAERDEIIRVHDEQTLHLEAQNEWARTLDRRIIDAGTDLTAAVKSLDVAEATVIERTLWAQRLDKQLSLVKASRWVRLGKKLGFGPNLDGDPPNEPHV